MSKAAIVLVILIVVVIAWFFRAGMLPGPVEALIIIMFTIYAMTQLTKWLKDKREPFLFRVSIVLFLVSCIMLIFTSIGEDKPTLWALLSWGALGVSVVFFLLGAYQRSKLPSYLWTNEEHKQQQFWVDVYFTRLKFYLILLFVFLFIWLLFYLYDKVPTYFQ